MDLFVQLSLNNTQYRRLA